jgi:thioredoxin reductase
VTIIGGGPAGLSAALVLGRCGRRVIVIDSNRGRNRWARSVNNFLTRDGVAPGTLRALGRAEIRRLGVEFLRGEATDAAKLKQGGFRVRLARGEVIRSRALLLATGVRDEIPAIRGLRGLYGRSVHHCPYCDAYAYRGEVIATIGDPRAALGLAIALQTWTDTLIVCTNGRRAGEPLRVMARRHGIGWREEPIVRLVARRGLLDRIQFAAGEDLRCAAVFFNTGQYQRSDLPRRLGCTFKSDGGVLTDKRQCTSVPGLYLAGDADRDVQFAIVAAAEGATAAVAINHQMQSEDAARRRKGQSSA